MNQEKLKIMEQTSAPRILVFLNEKGIATVTEIMDNRNIQGSPSAKYAALELLLENNLISQTLPQGQSRRIDNSLTEKGKKVADCLNELENLL